MSKNLHSEKSRLKPGLGVAAAAVSAAVYSGSDCLFTEDDDVLAPDDDTLTALNDFGEPVIVPDDELLSDNSADEYADEQVVYDIDGAAPADVEHAAVMIDLDGEGTFDILTQVADLDFTVEEDILVEEDIAELEAEEDIADGFVDEPDITDDDTSWLTCDFDEDPCIDFSDI